MKILKKNKNTEHIKENWTLCIGAVHYKATEISSALTYSGGQVTFIK